jgi:uncharacterized protein
MNPELERLIRLQQLETSAEDARRRMADLPQRLQSLDARLEQVRELVTGAKTRLAGAQEKRRADEKEVSTVQTRLAKYKDQLLEVKTNREYQAMLHEIEAAQNDIRVREDRILEIMVESDELSTAIKTSEAELKTAEKETAAERQLLDQETARLRAALEETGAAREKLAAEIDRGVLATFEQVARNRKGLAVAEARGGLCTICHVRLRPQVFNEVRRNASIIQCDSCRRILYFAGEAEAPAAVPSA